MRSASSCARAGQALRITVIGYRYIVRGGKDRRVHAEDLVTEGIFALARNPLYVGNMMVLFGLFIIWNSPLLYLVGVPFTVIGYWAIVAAEEAFLRGEVRCAVRRLLPRDQSLDSGFPEGARGAERHPVQLATRVDPGIRELDGVDLHGRRR